MFVTKQQLNTFNNNTDPTTQTLRKLVQDAEALLNTYVIGTERQQDIPATTGATYVGEKVEGRSYTLQTRLVSVERYNGEGQWIHITFEQSEF